MAFKRHLTRMTGLVIVTAFLISTTPVAATENLLQSYQGGYIESELDSNTPVYDSGISTFAELPLAFPDDASVFDTRIHMVPAGHLPVWGLRSMT